MNAARQTGFTLLEVLVALAVVALALAALVGLTGSQISSVERQREHLLAEYVAANVLTELRLREPFPETGVREGRTEMGGRAFRWRLTIGSTPEPAMRRLELSVARGDNDAPIASFSAFAGSRR